MDKEKFLAYQHHFTLAREHAESAYVLTRETPPTNNGEPKAIGSVARFDDALEKIKPFALTTMSGWADKSAKRSPAVPITGEHEGLERSFRLFLIIEARSSRIKSVAKFQSPTPRYGETFELFESVSRGSCAASEKQDQDLPNLNLIESSIDAYFEAARQLNLEQALELGFTQEMYEVLHVQP